MFVLGTSDAKRVIVQSMDSIAIHRLHDKAFLTRDFMIPILLTLRNFMCYRDGSDDGEPLALNFDGLHVVCLSGENGAGKSALLDAITWALWGKARIADDELIAQGESEMLVELEFLLGEQRYRVRRVRQRGKTGPRGGQQTGKSALDLQVFGGQGWRSLSETKKLETQSQVTDLLRMSYETFTNASFLLQGRADEFTRKTAAERKQVLAEMLDLQEYEALEKRARERARGFDGQIKGLEGRIGQLRSDVEKLAFWQAEVHNVQTRVLALSERQQQAEQQRDAAREQVRKLELRAEERKSLSREIARLRGEQQQAEQQIDAYRRRITASEMLLARADEIAAGMLALLAARTEQARLEALRPRHEELREEWRKYQGQIDEERLRLEGERNALASERKRLSDHVARRPTVRAKLDEALKQLSRLEPLEHERRDLRGKADLLDDKLSRASKLLMQRSEQFALISGRENSLIAAREEAKRNLNRLGEQLATLPDLRSSLGHAEARQLLAEQEQQRLNILREEERGTAERAGELRARCEQFKQQAEQYKKDRERLSAAQTTSCPVCRSELGHDGLSHVLEHYETQITALRGAYRDSNVEAKALDAALKDLRSSLAASEKLLAEAQRDAALVETLRSQIAQSDGWLRERDKYRFDVDDLERQISSKSFARPEREELNRIELELSGLGIHIPGGAQRAGEQLTAALERERENARSRITQLDHQLDQRPLLEGQKASNERELLELDKAAHELPGVEQRFAALDEILRAEDYAHALRSAQRAVHEAANTLGFSREAVAQAAATLDGLRHWEEEERNLKLAQARLEDERTLFNQEHELYQHRANKLEECTREDAVLEQELRALPQAQVRASEAEQALSGCMSELRAAERDLAEKETSLRNTQARAHELEEAELQLKQLRERHGVFQELGEAFGKKGVQAMLIETAIPQIEQEANRLLSRMTDNQMHVTLETQGQTKKGDTVETLEIKIADALGTRIYDAFSGGEAMRVNFAVRIALSRLLAHRAGARLETLVIDEGFGTLDAPGRERMVEAITGVQQDFKRIMVITHLDDLKDRFPATIEITKTASGSRFELR
jgi:exonuclease SbcC